MNEDVILTSDLKYESTKSIRVLIYLGIKRSFDIVLSLIGLLFLIPITVIVKIITMLSGDFNSIFFSQERIGKKGKIFKLYKFRSMVKDADMV